MKKPFTIEGFTLQDIAEALNPKKSKFSRTPEKVDSASRTIPDDSFTIKELFERLQNGAPLPLGLERPIRFSDDPTHEDLDLSKIQAMDLAEVQDYKKRVSDTLHFLTERKTSLEKAELEALAAQKAQNEAKNAS